MSIVQVEESANSVVVGYEDDPDVTLGEDIEATVTLETETAVLVVAEGIQGPLGPPGPSGATLERVRPAHGVLSGHCVVVERSDGSFEYADNATASHLHRQPGITTGAAVDGGDAIAVMLGPLTEPSWSWSPGAPLYLGAAGQLTQTPPAAPGALFLLEMGVALTAMTVFVQPQAPIALIT